VGVVWALLSEALGDTTAAPEDMGSRAQMEASTEGSGRGGVAMASAVAAKMGMWSVLNFMMGVDGEWFRGMSG